MGDFDKYSIEKLDVDNYQNWKVKTRALLVQKGLDDTLIAAPKEGEKDAISNDKKAKAFIMLCVKDHHLTALDACATTKEAWDMLASTYSAQSTARMQQFKRELLHLKKDPSEPITKYVGRGQALRQALEAAGGEMKRSELVLQLLAGLPPDYATISMLIENEPKLPELPAVLSKLLAAEQKIVASAAASSYIDKAPKAYNALQRPEHRTCYNCGKPGHIAAHCRGRALNPRQGAGRPAGLAGAGRRA